MGLEILCFDIKKITLSTVLAGFKQVLRLLKDS